MQIVSKIVELFPAVDGTYGAVASGIDEIATLVGTAMGVGSYLFPWLSTVYLIVFLIILLHLGSWVVSFLTWVASSLPRSSIKQWRRV